MLLLEEVVAITVCYVPENEESEEAAARQQAVITPPPPAAEEGDRERPNGEKPGAGACCFPGCLVVWLFFCLFVCFVCPLFRRRKISNCFWSARAACNLL